MAAAAISAALGSLAVATATNAAPQRCRSGLLEANSLGSAALHPSRSRTNSSSSSSSGSSSSAFNGSSMGCPAATAPQRRRFSVQTAAMGSHGAAAAELATYQFSQRRSGSAAPWFQEAVRDIVKHVDSQAPFLQTVRLGAGPSQPPCLDTYGVQESVVAAPELWQGIAEHLNAGAPDVVILVQRVSPHAADSPQGAMDAAEAAVAGAAFGSSSSSSSSSPPSSPRSPRAHEARVAAEEACRRLVSSGLADSVLQGQVGDCCDGSGHDGHHGSQGHGAAGSAAAQQGASKPLPLPSIVPFSAAAAVGARRSTVRAAALRPPGAPSPSAGACSQTACYWGVVVQSAAHTGVEGCYLLKTVKNVSPGTGCSCTHFSLTRISAGEHLEQQFVNSWLL